MINSLISPITDTPKIAKNNVISGRTQYMDLDTREIYEYHAGDFFVTFPGTTYVQKAEAGTKMIFVKEPSINDKELVPMA